MCFRQHSWKSGVTQSCLSANDAITIPQMPDKDFKVCFCPSVVLFSKIMFNLFYCV